MKGRTLTTALVVLLFAVAGAYALFFWPSGDSSDPVIRYPGQMGEHLDPTVTMIEENRRMVEAVTINRKNVRQVVALLHRPAEYETACGITYYYEGQPASSMNIYLWITPQMQKILQRSGTMEDQKTTLLANGNVYVWGTGQSGVEYTGRAGSFTIDDIGHMPTHERIEGLAQENILSAEFQELGEDKIPSLVIEALNPLSGYRERYTLRTDVGLMTACQVYDGKTLIYEMTQRSLSLEPVDRDTVFILPNGVLLQEK